MENIESVYNHITDLFEARPHHCFEGVINRLAYLRGGSLTNIDREYLEHISNLISKKDSLADKKRFNLAIGGLIAILILLIVRVILGIVYQFTDIEWTWGGGAVLLTTVLILTGIYPKISADMKTWDEYQAERAYIYLFLLIYVALFGSIWSFASHLPLWLLGATSLLFPLSGIPIGAAIAAYIRERILQKITNEILAVCKTYLLEVQSIEKREK